MPIESAPYIAQLHQTPLVAQHEAAEQNITHQKDTIKHGSIPFAELLKRQAEDLLRTDNHKPRLHVIENNRSVASSNETNRSLVEWWYITGFLWKSENCKASDSYPPHRAPDYGFQTTYFSGTNPETKNSGISSSGILAHVALSDVAAKTHHSSSRFSVFSKSNSEILRNSYAEFNTSHLSANLADWKILQLSTNPVRFAVNQSTNHQKLDYIAENQTEKDGSGSIWPHGSHESRRSNGVVTKLGGHQNIYISRPFLNVSAILQTETQSEKPPPSSQSQLLCGTAWLDHEIGVSVEKDAGWIWLSLRTPEGDAYMIYNLKNKAGDQQKTIEWYQGQKTLDKETVASSNQVHQGQEQLSRGPLSRVLHGSISQWQESEEACLGVPQICYPQKISFEASFPSDQESAEETKIFEVQSMFPEQEVVGPEFQIHSRYWEGLVNFKITTNTKTKIDPQTVQKIDPKIQSSEEPLKRAPENGFGYMEIVKE